MIKAICDCLILILNGVGFCKVIGEEVEYGSIFSAPVDGIEVGYKRFRWILSETHRRVLSD